MEKNKKIEETKEEDLFQELVSKNTEPKVETKTEKLKPTKKTKKEKVPITDRPDHWVLLHDFVPKKDYDVSFDIYDIGRLDNEPNKKSWVSLLSFLWLDTSYVLEEKEQDTITFGKRMEELYPNIQIGYITDFNHLIGYLVNRGPVILDDLVIFGVNTQKQRFETNKGPRVFDMIKNKLNKHYGISATVS